MRSPVAEPGAHAARALDLLYVGTLPPHTGGSGVLCGDLLPALAARGHRVRAVAPIEAGRAEAADAYAARHPAIAVERIVVPFFEDSPDTPAPASYREQEGAQIRAVAARLVGRRRPDVVIAGRESFAGHVADLARAHGLPAALLIQGATTWGILRRTIPEPMATRLLEQFRQFDLVVVVAGHLAATLAGLGLGPVVVVENTVDTGQFAPRAKPERLRRELGLPGDAIVVMHLSNLKPLKRPLDLVASARAALQREPRLAWVVVGDGMLRAEMEAACRREGVAERFRFAGWVDRDAVPDYLNLADIVVMPSAAEARSLVCLEAQACARVLLASDITAAREVVTDGEDGLLFPAGDVDALTAKTLALARDPELREAIGRRARRTALGRPLARMVDEYEAALRRVAREPRRAVVPAQVD